jgi:uncharacterized Zn finger protein (UPF0148 family)
MTDYVCPMCKGSSFRVRENGLHCVSCNQFYDWAWLARQAESRAWWAERQKQREEEDKVK